MAAPKPTAESAPPTWDARRILTVAALLVLALVLSLQGPWWGFFLVLIEVFASPVQRAMEYLERVVAALRHALGPLKRFPTALLGLPLLIVGVVLGNLAPDSVAWLGNGVEVAVRGIARAAPFVIFFTLTPAIAGTLAVGRAGKFALWVNGAYVILTLLAGLLAILILVPLFGVRLVGQGAAGTAGVDVDLGEMLFTTPAFLAIFLAAGLALMIHGFQLQGLYSFTRFVGSRLVDLIGDLLKILLPLILFALGVFIPTEVGAGIAKVREAGATFGTGWVGNLDAGAAYFVAVGALVLVLGIWITGLAVGVMRYTKFPVSKFFREYFIDVYSYAWATASSNATMPINLERTGSALRVRSTVREFIIPLGATVHLDGTIIGGMVTTVIAAQLVGYTPTLLDLFFVLVPLMIVTVGAPGIPGGLSIVGAPVVARLLPLPIGTEAAFTAIFVGFNIGLSDQFRTGVNSTGNGILCRLFEYWYPTRFAKKATRTAPSSAKSPAPKRPAPPRPKARAAPGP